MTRIGSNAPGNIFLPPPEPNVKEDIQIDHLPEELPPPSNITVSLLDFSKLILPENVDLSRVPKDHPICASFDKLWLEVLLRVFISGNERSGKPL